ncbi:MAG: 50S ribosomal protein L11 methyltransferase [Desulfobacteraceae bacterium]
MRKSKTDRALMKGAQEKVPSGESNGVCPYSYLYVYVLNGVLGASCESKCGETFMGNWVEDDTSFLFFSAPAENEIDAVLRGMNGLEVVETHVFPYETWQGGAVVPVRVDNFVMVPPWLDGGNDEEGIRIVIDPGVVFGNGLHPTTRDCLRALASAANRCGLGRVVDLGTGTGVLAIAAAHLGAESALGIDLNPLCVRTAERNAKLNGLTHVRMAQGDMREFALEPAELLVANIPHAVIVDILKKGFFPNKRRLILSGLMRSQALDVKSLLKEKGFALIRQWDSEMTWFTLLVEKVQNASVSNHGISI